MDEKDIRIASLLKQLNDANSTISALEQEIFLLETQLENLQHVRHNDKDKQREQ